MVLHLHLQGYEFIFTHIVNKFQIFIYKYMMGMSKQIYMPKTGPTNFKLCKKVLYVGHFLVAITNSLVTNHDGMKP